MPPPSGHSPPQSSAVPSPPSSLGSSFSSFLSSASLAHSRHSCHSILHISGAGTVRLPNPPLPPTLGLCVMNVGVPLCVCVCVLVPSFADPSPHLYAVQLFVHRPLICMPSPRLHAIPSFVCHHLICVPSPHLHAVLHGNRPGGYIRHLHIWMGRSVDQCGG